MSKFKKGHDPKAGRLVAGIILLAAVALGIKNGVFWTPSEAALITKDVYVSDKGSDTYNGSTAKPYRTISFAAQQAVAGQLLKINIIPSLNNTFTASSSEAHEWTVDLGERVIIHPSIFAAGQSPTLKIFGENSNVFITPVVKGTLEIEYLTFTLPVVVTTTGTGAMAQINRSVFHGADDGARFDLVADMGSRISLLNSEFALSVGGDSLTYTGLGLASINNSTINLNSNIFRYPNMTDPAITARLVGARMVGLGNSPWAGRYKAVGNKFITNDYVAGMPKTDKQVGFDLVNKPKTNALGFYNDFSVFQGIPWINRTEN